MRRWETLQARENESTWSPQHCTRLFDEGGVLERLGLEPCRRRRRDGSGAECGREEMRYGRCGGMVVSRDRLVREE